MNPKPHSARWSTRIRNWLATAVLLLIVTLVSSCASGPRWLAKIENEQPPIAIHGDIVTERGATTGWLLLHRGVILDAHCPESKIPVDAIKIRHEGYIFPGLIDTHNHPHYNAIPRWKPPELFVNRYQWFTNGLYVTNVQQLASQLSSNKATYLALKYGEIRAALGGTTSMQGTFTPPESTGLIRNLHTNYHADAFTYNVRSMKPDEVTKAKADLASGKIRRYFLHVAEGIDEDSRKEFPHIISNGLARAGVVVIHGITLERDDFKYMAGNGMFLVWSPRSNLSLYGKTADVMSALNAGVTVALAPDWTPSGSDNVLSEMKLADEYSRTNLQGRIHPIDLYRMVTVNAAKVGGLDGFLGKLDPRFAADLFLAPKLDNDPFVSLLKTQPRDINLVLVDGKPVYGSRELLAPLVRTEVIDDISVQGVQKGIIINGDLRSAPKADEHFSDAVKKLNTILPKVAPLLED